MDCRRMLIADGIVSGGGGGGYGRGWILTLKVDCKGLVDDFLHGGLVDVAWMNESCLIAPAND